MSYVINTHQGSWHDPATFARIYFRYNALSSKRMRSIANDQSIINEQENTSETATTIEEIEPTATSTPIE